MEPLLSIIIPVFNVEAYLEECFDSILAQTFTDWELLIVDDGSTDNSPQICDNYASSDNRITVFHTPNSGQSCARNKALDIAKGKYITFVDGDDYLIDNNLFSNVINILENDPSCDILQFNHARLIDGKLLEPETSQERVLTSITEFIENLDIATVKQNRTIFGVPWAKIYRHSMLSNMRFPENMFYEDTYYLCDLFEKTNTIRISIAGAYIYRMRPGSTTARPPEERYMLDRLTMQLRVLQSLLQHSQDKELKSRFVYDLLQRFRIVRNSFGPSSRYTKLQNSFASKIRWQWPIVNVKTFIKASILNLLGINFWYKLVALRKHISI